MFIRNLRTFKKKSGIRNVLRYMFLKNPAALHQGDQKGFVFTQNMKGSMLDEWEQEFLDNEQYRKVKRSDSVIIRHLVMSFHPKDTPLITTEMLDDLTYYFYQAYNPAAMGVATVHYDRDHIHVHHCIAGLEYRSGNAARHSKSAFEGLKKSTEGYQMERYPELVHSIVYHRSRTLEQERVTNGEYWVNKRASGLTKKEQLKELLDEAFKDAMSVGELVYKLGDRGITTYMRGGKLYGVVYNGRKYRFKTLGLLERLHELEAHEQKIYELSEEQEQGRGYERDD